jgi:CBS domain-containing protein
VPAPGQTENAATRAAAQSMYSPLSAVLRRKPVSCAPDTRMRDVLELMRGQRIGSMLVVDPATAAPLGIFTLRDLLTKVAVGECDLEQLIEQVMTRDLITLEPHVSAYQAAVTMARHGVRHIVVVEAGRLVGVVSENDLFNLQRVGVKELSVEIQEAGDLGALQQVARDIRTLARSMLQNGVGAEPLTQLISTLNDLLTLRIIEVVKERHALPPARLCWLALGSEGRFEQTVSTDQDNGLIFEATAGADPEQMRRALLPFAREVNELLDACGFPLCKGNVMASNPQWCLSLDEWRRTFFGWINTPQPEALLNVGIFFDFRALWGEASLADALRDWVLGAAHEGNLFLHLMARNALDARPPLGIIRDFVFDDSKEFPHTIDLKLYGARPFVDGARLLALAHGIAHTNTAQRLRLAAEKIDLGSDDVAAMIEGFNFIQGLRLRRQQAAEGTAAGVNRVDPRELNELDRHVLKEAFRQGRKLQQRIALDYRLS